MNMEREGREEEGEQREGERKERGVGEQSERRCGSDTCIYLCMSLNRTKTGDNVL